jgi:tRNA-dihydrouridine synthase A
MTQLSIAPMIDWSYSAFRVFMRILAPKALVYTEMQTTGAVMHNPHSALYYSPVEHPIALQLGGSDPTLLALCAQNAAQRGFNQVNLNLGCPSDKVQAGQFGACLMKSPKQVVDCISAMKDAVTIPVTAKTRIGVDEYDSYDYFSDFVAHLVNAGIDALIVHARKAWLHGLNPKQNRTIPPVNYDYVYRIKKEYPHLPVVINGSIDQLDEIKTHIQQVDGVMLGRLACNNPYKVAQIHHALHPKNPLLDRCELFARYCEFITASAPTSSISMLVKPIFNLAHGQPYAGLWKKQLMEVVQNKKVSALFGLVSVLSTMEEGIASA